MNPHLTPIVGLLLFFLAMTIAYTRGFQRGRATRDDEVGVWVWGSTAGSDIQRARGRLAELSAYADGEWEIQPHDIHGPHASGKEADQLRGQIRSMRVYRTLTEVIVTAGGEPQ
jgi:hypothetical protein